MHSLIHASTLSDQMLPTLSDRMFPTLPDQMLHCIDVTQAPPSELLSNESHSQPHPTGFSHPGPQSLPFLTDIPLSAPTTCHPYTLDLQQLDAFTGANSLPRNCLTITTPLHLERWSSALATHPDQQFSSYILQASGWALTTKWCLVSQ